MLSENNSSAYFIFSTKGKRVILEKSQNIQKDWKENLLFTLVLEPPMGTSFTLGGSIQKPAVKASGELSFEQEWRMDLRANEQVIGARPSARHGSF